MPLMYWRPCMELTVEADKGDAWRTLVVQVGPPISAGYGEALASNGFQLPCCIHHAAMCSIAHVS